MIPRLEGPIVIEKLPVAFIPPESLTVTETGKVPGVVGVPVTAPLEETVRPPPAVPVKVYGGVPPMAVS